MASSEQASVYIYPAICTNRMVFDKGVFFTLFFLNMLTNPIISQIWIFVKWLFSSLLPYHFMYKLNVTYRLPSSMTQSTAYSQTSPAFRSHPCGIAKWPLNTTGSLFDRCTGLTNLMQLNLSTMSTSGTETSGHCKEVAIVERFWIRVNVWIFCLPGQKKLAVVERWPLTCREVAVSRGSNCSFSRKYRRWLSEISTTCQVDLKVFLPLLVLKERK